MSNTLQIVPKEVTRRLICVICGCYAFHRNFVTPGIWAIWLTIGGVRM